MLTAIAHRHPSHHRSGQAAGSDYQYDGYPQGAASTDVHVVPITVLQEVANVQPAETNVRRWVDPTDEQGMGRDITFRNGWMKKAYVSDFTSLAHFGTWPRGPRTQQGKQHAPSRGPIQLAKRVNASPFRGGTLPAPTTVMFTVAGGEPL